MNTILNTICSWRRIFQPLKYIPPKGDLNKRWYIYFSFRDSETGNLKRVTPFYGDAHKYKTKEDRLFVLSVNSRKLLELLKACINPFEDNNSLYQNRQ